jgi:hypothetical protein
VFRGSKAFQFPNSVQWTSEYQTSETRVKFSNVSNLSWHWLILFAGHNINNQTK